MGFHTCWHKDETGFTSFFSRASFGYGCVVWDPFTKKDLIRFKIIQNLALRFGFRLKGWVSFFFWAKGKFWSWRWKFRASFYAKADERGVAITRFLQIDKHCDTRQDARLYVPSIRTNSCFNSFWFRTNRVVRGSIVILVWVSMFSFWWRVCGKTLIWCHQCFGIN